MGDIEFSQIELKVLDGLKAGNESLKQLNQLLSIENIEEILDETKESVAKQREINSILSGISSVDFDDITDDDLMDELNELTEPQILPDVPNDELEVPQDLSEDEEIQTDVQMIQDQQPTATKVKKSAPLLAE